MELVELLLYFTYNFDMINTLITIRHKTLLNYNLFREVYACLRHQNIPCLKGKWKIEFTANTVPYVFWKRSGPFRTETQQPSFHKQSVFQTQILNEFMN